MLCQLQLALVQLRQQAERHLQDERQPAGRAGEGTSRQRQTARLVQVSQKHRNARYWAGDGQACEGTKPGQADTRQAASRSAHSLLQSHPGVDASTILPACLCCCAGQALRFQH